MRNVTGGELPKTVANSATKNNKIERAAMKLGGQNFDNDSFAEYGGNAAGKPPADANKTYRLYPSQTSWNAK